MDGRVAPRTISSCLPTRAHATVNAHPGPATAVHQLAHASAADIHWANIAASIGGIATAGALLISLFLLRQQLRDQRQARLEKRRNHASQISFWLTLRGYDDGTINAYGDGSGIPEIVVEVHLVNTSQLPVMSVLALVGVRDDVWRDASTKDKISHDEYAAQWNAVAIAPGEAKEFTLFLRVPKSVVEIVADYEDPALIGELIFTDAAGVDWIRTHTGELIDRRSPQWIAGIPLSLSERHAMRSNQPAPSKETRAVRWARKLGNRLVSSADTKTD